MAKYMDDDQAKEWTGILNPFWTLQTLALSLPEANLRRGILGLVSYLIEFDPGETAAPVEVLDVFAQYAVQGYNVSPGSEVFEPLSEEDLQAFIKEMKLEEENDNDE